MPELDSTSKKVLIGASIAAVALSVAAFFLYKKADKVPPSPKSESEHRKDVESTTMASQKSVEAKSQQELKSPSWSDLVDEEETSEHSSQLMEATKPKSVPSNMGDIRLRKDNEMGGNDSGIVSPNDHAIEVRSEVRNDCVSTAPDGGLGSSDCGDEVAQEEVRESASSSNQTGQTKLNGCDSGQGSEADDGIRLAYHFHIPHYLCGKFIGANGLNVKNWKSTTKCSILLRQVDENGCFKSFQRSRDNIQREGDEVYVCLIEGTRCSIDHCLELIRQKFPVDQNPEFTLEQINLPPSQGFQNTEVASLEASHTTALPLQLGLTQGAMHEVYVSNIVSGGHIFLQQPTHPTHSSLPRLEHYMSNAYSNLTIPDIPREVIEPGLVCVAKCNNCHWYRVQVVRYYSSNDTCDVKFVDYGGYYNFPVSDLKQIRSDFLSLPFQALECYLGNVSPPDGKEWPQETATVLGEMVQNQIITGRMLGVNEDNIPIVHIYGWVNVDNASGDVTEHEQQPRLLNRELVDRGVASWTEHIIAN